MDELILNVAYLVVKLNEQAKAKDREIVNLHEAIKKLTPKEEEQSAKGK